LAVEIASFEHEETTPAKRQTSRNTRIQNKLSEIKCKLNHNPFFEK